MTWIMWNVHRQMLTEFMQNWILCQEVIFSLKEIEALLQPKNIISASDEELIQKVIPRAEHHLTSVQTDVLRINAILIRIFPAISLDSKTFLCTSQYRSVFFNPSSFPISGTVIQVLFCVGRRL